MADNDTPHPEGLSALLHDVAVNCGDHAETIVRAVMVDRDETVGDMMERLISKGPSAWSKRKHENFVVLRFVEQITPEPDPF